MAAPNENSADANRGAKTFSDWVKDCTLAMTLTYTGTSKVYQSVVPVSGLSVVGCFEHYFALF